MKNVVLKTNGQNIAGWNKVIITRSVKQNSGAFEITYSDSWIKQLPGIFVGLTCTITIDDTPIITGFIDSVSIRYSSNNVTLVISGRDGLGDLIDCDRITKPFRWRNLNLYQLAKIVTAPFNIPVTIQGDIGAKFTEASVDNGETIIQFIDKLAKQRDKLALSTTVGGLILTPVGGEGFSEALQEGKNYVDMDANFTFTNRFSDYVIKGQQKVKGGKDSWTDKTINIFHSAKDEFVPRFRSKLIIPSTQITTNDAKKMVAWEAQVRAGRGTQFVVTVPTWTQENGDLWKENLRTQILAPLLRIDGVYLLETIEYHLTEDNLFAKLYYVDEITYLPNPTGTIKKSKKKVGKYGWIK